MTAPTPPPKYIYKILPSSQTPPTPLPQALPLSALDLKDGYIHLSTSRQLLGTLRNFFASEKKVVILRIGYASVERFVRWEDGEGNLPIENEGCWDYNTHDGYFPHVYGNAKDGEGEMGLKLGRDEVLDWGVFEREEGKNWSGAGWCFDDDDRPS